MTTNKLAQTYWVRWAYYILGALLLCIPAFYNGYPLVYSDTGTYIRSGMEMYVPSDRPIVYGLFIRFFSLGYSLWFTVIAQCTALSFVLHKLIKHTVPSISYAGTLGIIAMLTAFTSVAWYSSQIMPDIFTFCSVACIILLTSCKLKITPGKILLLVIILFSFSVHFTNILLSIVMLCVFAILKFWKKGVFKTLNIKILTFLIFGSILLALSTNYAISKSLSPSKGGHIFMMGRMIDNGILKSYLDDNCSANKYSICQYKDSLPADSRAFLWAPNSPVQQQGWGQSGPEYREILLGIFTSPKHLLKFMYTSATASVSQLFQNDIGSGLESTWYAKPSSPPYAAVADFYPHEMNQYLQSRQNENLWGQGLGFSKQNTLNYFLLVVSVFIISLGLGLKENRALISNNLKVTAVLLLSGVVINAAVTASLANAYDRLQSRISWVIVLIALLILIQLGKRLYHNAVKLF